MWVAEFELWCPFQRLKVQEGNFQLQMKIMTWNVRGCGSYNKRRSIKEVISKEDPDMVVLQEVKKEIVDRRFVGSIWKSRFKESILLPSVWTSGGILVVWDSRRLKVTENLIGDFSVSIRVKMENFEAWWFSGFMVLFLSLLRETFGTNWWG